MNTQLNSTVKALSLSLKGKSVHTAAYTLQRMHDDAGNRTEGSVLHTKKTNAKPV